MLSLIMWWWVGGGCGVDGGWGVGGVVGLVGGGGGFGGGWGCRHFARRSAVLYVNSISSEMLYAKNDRYTNFWQATLAGNVVKPVSAYL